MNDSNALLDSALRDHLPTFVHLAFQIAAPGERFLPNWHIDAICHALRRVMSGETKRLIIEMPPRSLKSIAVSIAFPAFLLGHRPTQKIICGSYGSELSGQLSRACREVMRSPIYQRVFPGVEISAEKDRESYFRTSQGGFRYSTSVGGSLTGMGAGLLIFDDLLKPDDAYQESAREAVNNWFNRTARSRLNNQSQDAIIIVAQRLHAEDLPGRLRQEGGWEVLSLPAIAEIDEIIPLGAGKFHHRRVGDVLDSRRTDRHVLEGLRARGSTIFSAQYQQQPIPPDGELVKWGWFKTFDVVPMPAGTRIVQSWDTAIKVTGASDYSVCMTFAVVGPDYYLLDVFRKKLGFPDLKRAMYRLAYQWKADDIIIEDQGAGSSMIQQLIDDKAHAMPRPIRFKVVGDKVTRLVTASPLIEQGRVHLPNKADWLGEFKDELLQFPNALHDDQVDALSQFLIWIGDRYRTQGQAESRSLFATPTKTKREWDWSDTVYLL